MPHTENLDWLKIITRITEMLRSFPSSLFYIQSTQAVRIDKRQSLSLIDSSKQTSKLFFLALHSSTPTIFQSISTIFFRQYGLCVY